MSRTIVVGDIHGCYDELVELLDKVSLGEDDRVVAVGDLVVKGPHSRKVLDMFDGADKRFSSVMGNHDLTLLRHLRGEEVSLKAEHKTALEELNGARERYQRVLASLPFMIDLGAHVVVHGGVRPGVPLNAQHESDLTELRTLGSDPTSRTGTPWYEAYDGEKTVLFGHWPAREVRRARRAIGLDTGCVYGNLLTAYVIETNEFQSVRARRVYDHPKHGLP